MELKRQLSWVKSHNGGTAKVCQCCTFRKGDERQIMDEITGRGGVLQAERVHEHPAHVLGTRQV